ncbi:uncharacterized protein LOC143188944 [Calliopsis andreniformis]|uniref:uncharacterized protein LOC143188944 n=1 Tax=Calliopsis andreniformis TaxID=337506 RepID=UPI003FCEB99D
MVGDSPELVGEGSVSDLGDLEGWWDNSSIVAWSFALFGCFLLNVTLLLAFLIRPSLRTISNRFVMNLTVSNLLVCIIMNPLLVMDAFSPSPTAQIVESTSVGSVCAISEGAVAIVTTSSVLSVLLIAVDQYFAVVDPLRYRARVDKLKSGVLIMSIWLISIIFGFLAFFNPNPRTFWPSCIPRNSTWYPNVTSNSLTESTITVIESKTSELNVSGIPEILESVASIQVNDDIDLVENTTVMFDTLIGGTVTYGFVYAIVYSIFAYFIPFAAVCWIYVSIYVAAHRNSERARRSGSRPILSSASFTEEQNGSSRLQRLQADTIDDFRKIPKISSLSSIDETSETIQPTGQISRRRSFSSSLEIEVSAAPVDDKVSSGIVFTVGSERLDASQGNQEICTESNCEDRDKSQEEFNKESCSEDPTVHEGAAEIWVSRNFAGESSDSEDEARFECFDTLGVLDKDLFQYNRKFSSAFCDCQSTSSEHPLEAVDVGGMDKVNGTCVEIEQKPAESNPCASDQTMENSPQVEVQLSSQQGGSILRNHLEDRPSRRPSTTFVIGDVLECSSGTYNKTERDNATAGSNPTESSACLLAPIVTITPAPNKNESLHRVSSVRSTSSYINSLKDRISNGSIFRYREETRAARISALVIVMGLICWSPYVILLVMKNLPRSTDQHLPHKYDVLASSFLILAAYISPLLFGYRSKRVKRELRRFFCFRKELSYKNNRSLMAKKVLKRRHSSTLSQLEMDHKYNIFNCVYGRNRYPKEKVQFVQVPDTALAVETCRSSFSSGASTQISSTSTEEC